MTHRTVNTDPRSAPTPVVKDLVKCGYLKAAYVDGTLRQRRARTRVRTRLIVGTGGIFTQAEFTSGPDANEFRKTASIMKMVVEASRVRAASRWAATTITAACVRKGETKDERAGSAWARPRVRRPQERAADAVRLQRRLAVEQRA
jgi:hypothetical protein